MPVRTICLATFICLIFSCSKEKKESVAPEKPARVVNVPPFNSDSAFSFVRKQVDFGPRIPNTPAHRDAAEYFINKFRSYGASVTTQDFKSVNVDGQSLMLKNIIASYNPDRNKRILLAAHWDTRPYADKDKSNPNTTFQGANDGASGVAVLLEIARVIKSNGPQVGVDIILFDGEDWGEKEGEQGTHDLPPHLEEWWCLGSQYWAKNKHKPNYSAYYGILLDMVGAKNAQFHREGYSLEFAPSVVEKIWNTAARLGYSHVFVKQNQSEITDDHRFVNTLAKIPMVNIVHFEPGIGYFGDFHHTQKDNIDLIDPRTLRAVGETVLNVIYHEEMPRQ